MLERLFHVEGVESANVLRLEMTGMFEAQNVVCERGDGGGSICGPKNHVERILCGEQKQKAR
jgi:hypothetical protein